MWVIKYVLLALDGISLDVWLASSDGLSPSSLLCNGKVWRVSRKYLKLLVGERFQTLSVVFL